MVIERTYALLASNDVNGAAVFGEDGEKLGTVDHLVLDAVRGKIAYAVLAFGGVMGLGERTYSIPWGSIRFDAEKAAFITGISRRQIEEAPDRPDDWQEDRRWEERTFDHFGVPPYWL